MAYKCEYCINKSECKSCDKNWYDKFIPAEDVKKYFQYGYVGVRGINGYVWHFNTMNEDLKPTRHISIKGTKYCPYCGEQMCVIQEPETFAVTGYCCICEGARAELSYEEKRKELEEEYQHKVYELQAEYKDILTFQTEKLLEIKQRQEQKMYHKPVSYFDTINGESYTNITQIFD